MPTWRCTLRYYDAVSGLGWSITNYRADATGAAVAAAADAWNDAYLNCCNANTLVLDLRFSDVTLWRDIAVYDKGFFNTNNGQLAVGMMPVAEAALVAAKGGAPRLGSSYYHLHGMDISVFDPTGQIDQTLAQIIALVTACGVWFRQYRPAPSPVHALPAVNPPVAWTLIYIEGPYVRRLGTPFTLPGQRARR